MSFFFYRLNLIDERLKNYSEFLIDEEFFNLIEFLIDELFFNRVPTLHIDARGLYKIWGGNWLFILPKFG